MCIVKAAIALMASLLVLGGVEAKELRSVAAKTAFVRANSCPATGATKGSCPGYVVDHIEPLCAGGADAPSNMQWQTLKDSKVKDRKEWAQCRAMRKASARAVPAHPSNPTP